MSKNPKLLSSLLKQTTKNSSSLMTGERDPNGVLFVHEFDSSGRIVEVIDGVDASWLFSSTTTSTSQRYDLTNPEGEIIAYSDIDRVFTTTLPSGDIITKTTTYNNHGELLTQSDNTLDDQLEAYGNNTYTYNDDGYLTQKTTPEGTTSYSYGTSGELKEVVTPTNTITYLHNAQNQRVAKLVDGNITEKYLWANLTTLLAIYDKDNNLLQRFTYTDNRMPISMINNGVKYYLHYNQIGTLKAVSNTNHNIVKQITYDTYGNILTDTNQTLKVPFRFAGGLYDTDTKLTRFGYRDYDAYTGKWTAKDPIGFAGGDSNLYGYVLGDPVNLIDPWGLSQADVDKIRDTLYAYVIMLNGGGLRLPGSGWLMGSLNNYGSSFGMGYLGCIDQANLLMPYLEDLDLDDQWNFQINRSNPFHNNVSGVSSNPNDPNLIIDPWMNSIR